MPDWRASLRNGVERTAGRVAQLAARGSRRRIALCYHGLREEGVDDPAGYVAPHRGLPAAVFAEHLKFLREQTQIVTLEELLTGSVPYDRGVQVALTFDDGYASNFHIALPLLRSFSVPMTWFVASDYVEDPMLLPWWDLLDYANERCRRPLSIRGDDAADEYDMGDDMARRAFIRAARAEFLLASPARRDELLADLAAQIERDGPLPRNAYCRPEQVREMSECDLIAVGAHSASHPNLRACADDEIDRECTRNNACLDDWTGRKPELFAYPYGGPTQFDQRVASRIEKLGYRAACTTVNGRIAARRNEYMLPRVVVPPHTGTAALRARVFATGMYGLSARIRARGS